MAYTSVKVTFELGHEAFVRNKKTPQGFTHDWDLFIRGADGIDIHHFVDKVVFHLHDSFPIPKRVIKEPPYTIRESGYAGFTPIVEVYLKNKPPGEPSKIRFDYNLTLPSLDSPPYSTQIKETYIFNNPSEDFRRKLIKAGGVGVVASSTPQPSPMAGSNSSHSADDHKTSGSRNRPSPQDTLKKSKKENSSKHEERLDQNDPFSIFGAPIIKKEIPYTTTSKSNSKSVPEKASLPSDKQAHSSKSSKHNSSSHKEKDRDKEREREKEKPVEKAKEREKEKNGAVVKRSSKDADSLLPLKKVKKEEKDKISKSSKEDSKMKPAYHEEKQKEKSVEKPVTAEKESSKVEKKDKEKKHKDEKKLKSKDKHKNDKKDETYVERSEKSAPVVKEEIVPAKDEKKAHKVAAEEREEKSALKEKTLYNNDALSSVAQQSVVPTFDAAAAALKKDDKHKHHKHKKEKSKKEGKRDREEKKEKMKEGKGDSKERTPVQTEPPPKSVPKQTESPKKKKPLTTLFDELSDKSDSDLSSDNDMPMPMAMPQTLREPDSRDSSPELTHSVVKADTSVYARHSDDEAGGGGTNKRKSKKSGEDKEAKKRKRKSKHRDDDPTPMTLTQFDDHRSVDGALKHNGLGDVRQTSVSPSVFDPKFTEEYISKLKLLQEKIMTMDDNTGLQRIVQVVAETGQYEITTKTFDFDLCMLDEKIVDKLLELLA